MSYYSDEYYDEDRYEDWEDDEWTWQPLFRCSEHYFIPRRDVLYIRRWNPGRSKRAHDEIVDDMPF